ncbi:MAG: PDDEXK nuclease domain-containing protein [Bacteroidia bacterium]
MLQNNPFSSIIQLIKQSRANALRVVNAELINLYWNVGAYIVSQLANSNWGEKTVEELALFIENNHSELKGFNKRGLYRMKQFYETYSLSPIVSLPMTQLQNNDKQEVLIVSSAMTQLEISNIRGSILTKLSWTHHLILMSRAKSIEERLFYLQLSIDENYSVKELERQINASAFERTIMGNVQLSPKIKEIHPTVVNNFKDSYVFEFLNLPQNHTESDLQQGLISQMKNAILELGKDFLFVQQEYKLQVGNTDFYIDLLFYHRKLQCLVAFELKADKFKPEHLGQLNFYLEALDRDVKNENENPSIGILLCKDKDNEVVEYALSRSLSPTLVAQYKTLLPNKEVLQQKLHELLNN